MTFSKLVNIPKPTRYQNAALNYYLGLTNSPYLHYGYWENIPNANIELTIGDLKKAQQAYADKLLSFITPGTKTILDVGCGIGGNAAYLLKQGFEVEGLAPDPFQEEKFLENTENKAKFHLTRFEDFKTTHKYDLVLFSESSQYIAAHDIAFGVKNLLNPGGYLLIADMMRSDSSYTKGIFSNCHSLAEIHETLKNSGFTLIQTEDISPNIAPTIDLYVDSLKLWGLTTLRYVGDLMEIAVPPIYTLCRWAFRKWFKKLLVEGLESPNIFAKHLCYQIQLWQLTNIALEAK